VCVWVLKLSGEWIDKFREVIVWEFLCAFSRSQFPLTDSLLLLLAVGRPERAQSGRTKN
jgi:hypothetical protein